MRIRYSKIINFELRKQRKSKKCKRFKIKNHFPNFYRKKNYERCTTSDSKDIGIKNNYLLQELSFFGVHTQRIEYILEGNLLEKSVKRPFCCTVSILQVYFTYLCYITCWALEYHFIENLKLLLKENQIMKLAGFITDQ